MTEQPKENPSTYYEKMLDRNSLDCCVYGCWKPAAAFGEFRDGFGIQKESRFCKEHAMDSAHCDRVTRWLET